MYVSSPAARLGVFLAGLVLCSHAARAEATLRETSDFAEVAAHVEALAAKHGAANVLVACDFDNTLLSMDQDLGSDQWFTWQEYLLAAEPHSPALVAPDFSGLLVVQGVLFDALPMSPPQENLPELVGRLQSLGVKTIVLTARGDDFRRDAEEELKRNGYDLMRCPFAVAGLPLETKTASGATFLPYDIEKIEEAGITPDEAKRWNLKPEPLGISYKNGLCMVSGQHKGAMLAMLLKKAVCPPKAVVFVDQEKQVRRVADAMLSRDVDFIGFDYQKEDMKVKRFTYGDKTPVIRQWEGMKAALEKEKQPAAKAAIRPAAVR